jgi:hypothetical protein
MDFKSLINKLDSMEAPPQTPQAPKLPATIKLDEDAELRVLAGTSTILAESQIMEKKLTKAEKATKDKKTDEGLDMNLIKAASEKGMGPKKSDPESDRNIHKKYGSRSDKATDDGDDDEDDEDDEKATKYAGRKKPAAKKSAKKESIDPEQFRSKFLSLVEAKKKEAEMKTAKGKKAEEKMDEGKKSTKKKPDADGDGVPDWADKKPGEDDNAGNKPAGKKGMTAAQKKLPPGLQKAIAAKKGKKKVKESLDELFVYHPDGKFGYGDQEGPEDLLSAVEQEIENPGMAVDNLTDVLNATFDSDDSPEFEKARMIIEKYIELVTNADIDHASDDADDDEPEIRRMGHGDLARHIREYDLTDRLQHAAAMLEKIIGKSESADLDEFFSFDGPDSKKKDRGEDELARRQEKKVKTTDPSYKQKDDPKYGGRYKIGGPKGKLPESQRRSKKVVSESTERKLSFREMMKLVVESGGQQQIDPLDKELFNWATRVAKSKFQESRKSEVYAGLVYERMGGRFEMYDVLSESQKKKINEDEQVYDRDAIAGAIESIYDEFIESEKFQRSYNEPVSRFERRYEPWLDLIEKFFSSDRTVEEIADRLHYYQREPNVRSFLKWILRGGQG